MRIASLFRIACAFYALCLLPPAQADIYGYIDEQGIAHFAPEKLDARYQLFLRGGQALDTTGLQAVNEAKAEAKTEAKTGPALREYLSQHPNLKKFEPLIQQAAREFSVDAALLKAVMAAESGFNPAAVSPKGAIGLMQVMPATAERYGLQAGRSKSIAQKLTDPAINIRVAARYLRDLQRLFSNQPDLVLASYNAGEKAVQKYRNAVPPYSETRNYVQIVTRFYELYRPQPYKPITFHKGVLASSSAPGSKRMQMTIPGRRAAPDAPQDDPINIPMEFPNYND